MFRSAPRSSFQIHPLALKAYDVLLTLGIPSISGPGLCLSAPNADQGLPSLAVAGFGWLHCGEEFIPVVDLPAEASPAELRRLAWREVAAHLRALSATPSQRAAFLVSLNESCPPSQLGLLGVPPSLDIEPLRRKLRVRRARL